MSSAQALLPHFILGYINKSSLFHKPCDQIWRRNDKCSLSIHKTGSYYCLPSRCARTQAGTRTLKLRVLG